MRTVRLIHPGKPLEERQIDLPVVSADDVLIEVRAAGICHSDAHYRAGRIPAGPLPLTLGHEVAGVVAETGAAVSGLRAGDRVCVHYLAFCGVCESCRQGQEQFCSTGAMIGKDRDGGYAEDLLMPAMSVLPLPDEIPFEAGAVLMCSWSTALHALHKSRLKAGESVAIFGIGGLGIAAVQLARILGAGEVYAVDIKPGKLALAEQYGAVPVNAASADPVQALMAQTDGRGVDVAVELIGLPLTISQAVKSLGLLGRAVVAGVTEKSVEIAPYADLITGERELIGVSDHLSGELEQLLEWARTGWIDLSAVVTRTVALDAAAINHTLDRLESFSDDVRVVIQL